MDSVHLEAHAPSIMEITVAGHLRSVGNRGLGKLNKIFPPFVKSIHFEFCNPFNFVSIPLRSLNGLCVDVLDIVLSLVHLSLVLVMEDSLLSGILLDCVLAGGTLSVNVHAK